MCWGFRCDDGWYQIIDELCTSLQSQTDNNGFPQIVAFQVKEKFGTLRFYVLESNQTQRDLIAMAEHMSSKTCEKCGDVGKLRKFESLGRVRTLCDSHAKELGYTL
jgi:hypothetical protein